MQRVHASCCKQKTPAPPQGICIQVWGKCCLLQFTNIPIRLSLYLPEKSRCCLMQKLLILSDLQKTGLPGIVRKEKDDTYRFYTWDQWKNYWLDAYNKRAQ